MSGTQSAADPLRFHLFTQHRCRRTNIMNKCALHKLLFAKRIMILESYWTAGGSPKTRLELFLPPTIPRDFRLPHPARTPLCTLMNRKTGP